MNGQSRPEGPALRFGILGALRVEVGGDELRLGSRKQRVLLAALLAEAGAVISTDRLADILWGEDQPDGPAGAIQTQVSRLRGALARGGGAPARDVLVTRPGGYAVIVAPDRVDAGRFERLLAEVRAAPAPRARVELTGRALRLWRGPPLPECDHARAIAEAARLAELRWVAVELRADAMLRLGRHQDVVAELEVPIASHPLREQLRGLLMVALYRAGRQADALATYRELRETLAGDLGIEPSAVLRELERAILLQAEHLPWPAPPVEGGVDVRRPGGVPRTSRGTVDALPDEVTSFVGRQADLRGVTAALKENRIVVLTGVGGVGKSRLAGRVARELAEDYVDGVVLCDLVSAEDSSAVPDVVATALGVLPSERGSIDSLPEVLRGQQVLLVVDNCEHVLDGASELVNRLRSGCPTVDVLATSRQPLHVAGQQVWPVLPLDVVDRGPGTAVELFCQRAASADPTVEWTGPDRTAALEVCRRLDGLPLAIELAAARTRSMTPTDIAERLDARLDVLTDGSGVPSPRHRSLHAMLDWSYELLPVVTRRLFDRLAVFAGGFAPDAAGRVCAGDGVPPGAVADRLAELVDHSLVVVDRSDRHARYRLLETLQSYGEAHLEERGELPSWRRRHAEHYLVLAANAADGLRGPDEASWVHLVDTEFANVRAAQHRACTAGQLDVALGLPGLLGDYAYYRLSDEVYAWAERALELPGVSTHPARPAALLTAAIGRMQRGELDRALEDGAQVLAATSDEQVILRATQLVAEIALYQGRLDDVDRWGDELRERARSAASAYFEALSHLLPVHAAAYRGQPEEARSRLDSGWQVAARAGTPSLRAGFSYLEGEIRLDAAPEVALAAFSQAIEATRPVRNRFVAGVARVSVASLAARHGKPEEALLAFREIVDYWRTCGDRVHLWTTLHNLVVLLERVGADEAAAVLHGAVCTATTGAPPFGADADRLQVAAVALRRSLGEETFAAADTRGRCMSDEDVVTFVLEQIERLLTAPSAEGSG
ncbi:BTAD domain-containing putative transcriptional regulator [Blastococcus saxobsidens]|uniref:AfsR transcriptional regulator n=1 Tax=Blastococcus saxobsidens (strain DD2) TaxID=1146883 RepID=H6RRB0_BLASD|nr:BTAD domain-containing putative transcriptional regulator [Blastococcus saxobsidens]CCG04190.1 afsR transcriptional regulator [Blastococcus saxobsidens DD2]